MHRKMCAFSSALWCLLVSLCTVSSVTIHGCVLSAIFHHIRFSIALYQSISPYHHFISSPSFHNFTSKRRRKSPLDHQDIELFGSCGLNEGDSEEYLGDNNGAVEAMKEEEEEE